MRNLPPILLLVLLSSSVVFSQTKPKSEKFPLQRPPEIDLILNNARSLPAEFAVDSMIEIANSRRVVSKEWKKEILEEAFKLIPGVQNPVRRRVAAFDGMSVDTRPGYYTYAFDLSLDALSLRMKIISTMQALDKQRALQLTNTIPPTLELKPIGCAESMVFDVGPFYQQLGTIVESSFDVTQIGAGERLQFLRPYVEGMLSHAQVEPLATLLLKLKLNPTELFELRQTFFLALKKIPEDDRSFATSIRGGRTTNALLELTRASRKLDAQVSIGIEAVQSYLLTNLKQSRCQENVDGTNAALISRLLRPGYIFDSTVDLTEIKPKKIEPSISIASYYQTKESKNLMAEFKDLRWNDEERVTDAERSTAEWQQRMLDYLGHLQSWEGTAENSPIDHFHQKCIFYRSLLELAPAGPPREQVLRSFIKVLNNPTIQKENRIEWMFHARNLIAIGKKATGDERTKVIDLLFYSQQPVLQLYGSLIKEGILN